MPPQSQPSHIPAVTMLDSSYGCAPPSPILFPIWNVTSNETSYLEIPQEINHVEITFNYEIQHWSGVDWDNVGDSDESDSDGGWFSKLFGGRVLNDYNNSLQWPNDTDDMLQTLENVMVTSIWNTVLNDPSMGYNENGTECTGLLVSEEDETMLNDDVNAEIQAERFETRLLGLSAFPADEVNSDGCITPSDQCTSISGKISATYSGTNEFSISNHLVNLLSVGMETGQFIAANSPALMIEFVTVSDMSAGETSGMVVPIQTDRGTIWQVISESEDVDSISQYGKLFVALLAVLSVGFVIASVFKSKKRNKRRLEEDEVAEEGRDTNHTVREEQITEENLPMKEVDLSDEEEGETKSVASGMSSIFGKLFSKKSEDVPKEKELTGPPIIDQVALEIPRSQSGEIEVSLK